LWRIGGLQGSANNGCNWQKLNHSLCLEIALLLTLNYESNGKNKVRCIGIGPGGGSTSRML